MVAFIADASYANVPDTPSGWTKIIEHTGSLDMTLTCFAKIASSGDAGATNFTFTHPNGSATLVGMLYRITGTFSSTDNIYKTASNTGTEPSADVFRFANGITPTTASSLLIMAISGYSGSGSFNESHASAYAIETNNPTWTERDDLTFGGANFLFSTASATRTETTATGYYQVTYSVSGDDNPSNAVGILIAITDTANGTATPAVISLASSVPTPTSTGAGNVTASVISLTSSMPTATGSSSDPEWVNTDKPSPGSISNVDKP